MLAPRAVGADSLSDVCVCQEPHHISPVAIPVSLVMLQNEVCTVWRLATLTQWMKEYAALYGTPDVHYVCTRAYRWSLCKARLVHSTVLSFVCSFFPSPFASETVCLP